MDIKELNEKLGLFEDTENTPDVTQRRENLGKAAEAEGWTTTAIANLNGTYLMVNFEGPKFIGLKAILYFDQPTKFVFDLLDEVKLTQDDAIAFCEEMAKAERIIKSL